MITELRARNFKGWRKLEALHLKPLTGLFGPNSAGKTSILQLLLLLRQSAASADRRVPLHLGDNTTAIELGTYRDVIFGHDQSCPLEFGLTWRPKERLRILDPENPRQLILDANEVSLDAEVLLVRNQPRATKVEYSAGGQSFSLERADGSTYKITSSYNLSKRVGRPSTVTEPNRFYGFPDVVSGNYTNASFLADFELSLEDQLKSISYLGPLRENPRRQYTWAGVEPQDVGIRGERTIEALLAARNSGRKIRPGPRRKAITVEEWVARWLKDLGLISSFQVLPVVEGSPLYEVRVKRTPVSPEVLLTDVGFGVSQVLPVLVLLSYAEQGSVVLLEQPEIHLHPAVQAGLADAVLDAIRTRGIQVIVESHSEHFLQRVQRRVGEATVVSEQIALLFVTSESGQSRVEELRVDMSGNIVNWPQGFFGDPLGDAIARTRAAQERLASA